MTYTPKNKKLYLDNRISFSELNQLDERYKENKETKLKIPKIIHQTFSDKMDIEYFETCMINKNMNADYTYKFYNDEEVIDYIQKQYPIEYLKAYNRIVPKAYKADLFRYLVLYKEGGVYMDCKSSTIVPLRRFIKPDIGFVSFKDRPKGTIQISFLASIPGHPIIKKCIDRCIFNIENKKYGENMIDITGPQVCGRVFNQLLGKDELSDIDEGVYPQIDAEIIGSIKYFGKKEYEVLCDQYGGPLVSRTCGSYRMYDNIFSKVTDNSYSKHWNFGLVYKD
jgi:mannosyltransferase OCH1-like enzyme